MPKKQKQWSETKLGSKFQKPDMERIGLFIEMAYLSAKTRPKEKTHHEGPNFFCEGHKSITGTQHGYFEPDFKRIFSKEALKGRGRKPQPPKFKNVSAQPFMPPIGFKMHSSPGDYYGTFSGNIEAFSNQRRKKPPYKPELPNFYTSPAKKGGTGYVDITISPYPEHKADRYGGKVKYKEYGKVLNGAMVTMNYPQAYFDLNPYKEPENMKPGPTYVRPKEKVVNALPPGFIVPTGKGKLQGGCHAGGFEKWPEFKSNRNPKAKKRAEPEKVFYPCSREQKSFYYTSVVNQNVDFRLNCINSNTFQPTYTKYLLNE